VQSLFDFRELHDTVTISQTYVATHPARSAAFTRRGTRKKKLEIVELWRCTACKRTFTPGPAALRNKTYPLRMILAALTDYNLGYTLEEIATRLKKKTNRRVSPSTVTTWLEQYQQHCSYRRLRAAGLKRCPANQTIRSIKLYHRHTTLLASPTSWNRSRQPVRTICSAGMTNLRRGRRRRGQAGLTHPASSSAARRIPRPKQPLS